jgi:hypothetical protein
MGAPKLTNDKNELIIKKRAWLNLILGLPAFCLFGIFIFFGKETNQFFKEDPVAISAFVIIFLSGVYFLVRNGISEKIKMVINHQGIWMSDKGLFEWQKIYYYYFEEVQGDGDATSFLRIKLWDREKVISLEMSFWDTSEQDIEAAINKNSVGFNIIKL